MSDLSDAAVARLRDAVDRPSAGDRYVVHELLGRGGMGAVYRATDQLLQRDVALKVLSTDQEVGDIADRLRREARVLASLDHPGIVAIHDAGTLDDGRPFHVMRLIRGRRLDEHAREDSRGESLRRFLAVCDAVSFAHARGVIHRDLKPGNIMVGEFGEVLVVDWGIARQTHATEGTGTASTAHGRSAPVGTPGYMAPEQAGGGPADPRSDVYSLGAMLRDLLTARDEHVPAPLQAIVRQATAVDPGSRYTSVDALAVDVRAWLDQLPVSAYREGPVERAMRLYRRHQALILLLVAYLVVRVAILLWRGV